MVFFADSRRIAAAIVVLVLLLAVSVQAQVSDRSTLTGKVLCGYQGWFACPGDGNTDLGWQHWGQGGIGDGYYNTDIWPDVTEIPSDGLFACGPGVTLTSGKPAYLPSPRKQSVTNTHFRWMQENNIDGVYLQRFSGGLGNPGGASQQHKDAVLQNVMNSCAIYGRTFCIEYDLSGTADSDLFSKLTNDWTYLNNTFNVSSNPRYQYHNGKPVVCLWGLVHDRPYNTTTAMQVINWFKSNGVFLMDGTGSDWRTQPEPWASVYRSFNAIQPWTVGAYLTWGDISGWINTWTADVADCNAHGILFVPVAWPRFGWDNENHLACGTSKFGTRGGRHFWDQFYGQKVAGATSQKIAMFDEADESTAILKMSDDVPIGTQACFWTSEGLPHDWYLRLADYAGKQLRGEIALSSLDGTGEPVLPIVSTSIPDNATIVSDTIPTTMNPGQQYSVSVTVQNTGETCWNPEFFKLGAVNDSDPFTQTTRQTMTAGATVMPNGQYTFNFTLRAPSHNGTYISDWQMSHELIRWFGAKLTKVITVGTGATTLNNSDFTADANGWTTTTWKAGTSSAGSMTRTSGIGNPGYAMRCAGSTSTDNTDRCQREGAWIEKTVSTTGYNRILVYYDLKVNGLGTNYTGAGTGTCTVDHNLIDEQITVFYSTNGGSTWTEADTLARTALKASYSSFGTRMIDLSDITACSNNANFRLKFRWQLNTSGDYADLDNIKVLGNVNDTTPPAPVTNLVATPGNRFMGLSWTNPSDVDYTGAIVRYRTDAYPTSSSDGVLVTDKPGTPGVADSCIHTGLTNGGSYYYAVFAHDDSGLSAPGVTASGSPSGITVDWVNEIFDDYSNGNLGGVKWSATKPGCAQVQSAVAKGGTGKAALLDTIAAGNDIANEILITDKTAGYCYLSFDVAQDAAGAVGQTIGYVTIYGADSQTEITQIQIQKNRLLVEFGTGSLAVIATTQTNLTWYNVKIGLDIDTKMMDFWLDGVSKGTGYAWRSATEISRIVVSSDRNTGLTTQRVYVDNLILEPRLGPVAAVWDYGAWSPSQSRLHFGFDPAPYTSQYRYCIGTTSGGSQTRGWTVCGTCTDVVATGLALAEGTTYYVSVQCGDQNGNWGSSKTSDGIKVAPAITDINAAKALPDGGANDVKALTGKLVSAAFVGYFYVQEPDCLAGMKIASTSAVSVGDQVDICGVMRGSGSERYLDGTGCGVIRTTPGPGGLYAVTMTNASVGGADLNAFTPGIAFPMGPNNIGLLVTVIGKVTQKDPSGQYFYIDDGGGLHDGTMSGGVGNVGLRIIGNPALIPDGSYVAVTGISSVFSDNGLLKRGVVATQVRVLH